MREIGNVVYLELIENKSDEPPGNYSTAYNLLNIDV